MTVFRDELRSARADSSASGSLFSQAFLWTSRLLALVVMALYFPVLLGVAALVMMTSSGPACIKKAYRRKTADGAGQVVYLYEFRTECWQTWQETSVGAWIRRLDLHRLPRLANVLTGEIRAGERVQPLAA